VGKTFLRFAARNPSPLYKFWLAETRRKSNPATGLAKTVRMTTNVDHDSVFAAKVGGETCYIKIEHPGLLTALKYLGISLLQRPEKARNPEFVLTNVMRDLQDPGRSSEKSKGVCHQCQRGVGAAGKAERVNLVSGRVIEDDEAIRICEVLKQAGAENPPVATSPSAIPTPSS
jgi:hypothetical protein